MIVIYVIVDSTPYNFYNFINLSVLIQKGA